MSAVTVIKLHESNDLQIFLEWNLKKVIPKLGISLFRHFCCFCFSIRIKRGKNVFHNTWCFFVVAQEFLCGMCLFEKQLSCDSLSETKTPISENAEWRVSGIESLCTLYPLFVCSPVCHNISYHFSWWCWSCECFYTNLGLTLRLCFVYP